MKKKIAIFVYDISLIGGAEHVAVNLANELCKIYDVSFISCFNINKNEAFQINKQIHKFVLSSKLKSLSFYSSKLSKILKQILIKNDIRIIINITAGVNTISYLATHNTSTKVIYCEHSNLFNKTYGIKHQFRQWLGSKTADKIISLTEADQHEFEKKYNIQGKINYIYNWFDGEIYNNYNKSSKKIISVGRLEYVKGYDRLIQVANIILKKHKDWTWDIYGEGSYRNLLEKKIRENNLEGSLFLKGNNKNIIKLYKNYSFLVMTSYFEGLPMSLLEAKANSLPIVSFNCPTGPSEIIKNAVDGFLIDNGNCNAMIDSIETLIQNIELRTEFADKASLTLSKFEKNLILSKWISVIEDLL